MNKIIENHYARQLAFADNEMRNRFKSHFYLHQSAFRVLVLKKVGTLNFKYDINVNLNLLIGQDNKI